MSQAVSLTRDTDQHVPCLILDLRPFPSSHVCDIPADIWLRLAGTVRAVQMPHDWTSRDLDWLSALSGVDMIECSNLPIARHPFHGLPRSVQVVITPQPHPDWRCAEHRDRLFLSTAESGEHAYLNAFSSQPSDAAVWTLRLAADRPQDEWPSPEHYTQAAAAARQLAARARAHTPHDGQDQRRWLVEADQAKLIGAVIQRTPVTLLSDQGRTALLALQHQARGPEPLAVMSSWQLHVIEVATRAAMEALLLPDVSPPAFKPASALMALAQQRALEAEARQPPRWRSAWHTAHRPRPHALARTFSDPAPAAPSLRRLGSAPPRWSIGPLHVSPSLPQVQHNLAIAEAILPTAWVRGLRWPTGLPDQFAPTPHAARTPREQAPARLLSTRTPSLNRSSSLRAASATPSVSTVSLPQPLSGPDPLHRRPPPRPVSEAFDEVDGPMGPVDFEPSDADDAQTTALATGPIHASTYRISTAEPHVVPASEATDPDRPAAGPLTPTATPARIARAGSARLPGVVSPLDPSRERKTASLTRAASVIEARPARPPLLSRLRKLLSPPRNMSGTHDERFPALPPLPPAAPLSPWAGHRAPIASAAAVRPSPPAARAAGEAPSPAIDVTPSATQPVRG